MSDQTRKMTPPKKPVDQRRPIGTLGPTPLRMITTYMLNSGARKQFKKDTKEYEQKKAAYDEAIERMNTKQKQKKAKTTTTDIRKRAVKEAKKRSSGSLPKKREEFYEEGKSLLKRRKKTGDK